jgi:hypothetical protein
VRLNGFSQRLRDPYVVFCLCAVALWLIAWLAAFHNLYGWLVDDEDTFYRVRVYALGRLNLFDIQWFHAYMWFLASPALLFHWSVPSHVAAREFAATPQFRAFILYTILLHAIVLGLLGGFLYQLCSNRFVAGAAFLLVLTSPTLALYTPFLDSRYVSLLAALPALMLLLKGSHTGFNGRTRRLLYGFLPGFLLGVAQDVHYECLYLVAPFAALFWGILLAVNRRDGSTWSAFGSFVVGLLAWLVPVQLLSMLFHPFSNTFLGLLLAQYGRQIQPYTQAENMATWRNLFVSEMGIPMMVAAGGGYVILIVDRLRPSYIRRFDARLIVGSSAIFSMYLLASHTFPFYRMAFCYQFFYALAACVFVERVASAVSAERALRYFIASVMLLVLAIVPSFLRTPQVYVAQQGYGAAVNAAYAHAGPGRVYFIDTFDTEVVPQTVTTRAKFDHLSNDDYLVTYFPETFHFKYPDLFALLESVKPVAQFPTTWCTKEMWAQVPSFYGNRVWADEPQNCQVRVYHVADIRRAQARPTLRVVSVSADSLADRSLGPRRVLAQRNPSASWYGTELWDVYWHLWVSSNAPGTHWLELRFAEPERISQVTIVPPDYRVPPDFLWRGRKRVSNIALEALQPDGKYRRVWTGSRLENQVIVNAAFPAVTTRAVRIVLWQSPFGPNDRVGLKYVAFPEYKIVTAWNNVDPPGLPGPGR